MNSEVKIPTLLGLAVLIIGLGVGIFLVSQNQILKSKASQNIIPKKINVVNINGNSASIYWQTDQPVSSFIQAGPMPSLGLTFKDDRDTLSPKAHLLHFVTLTGLTPDTTYYYKITTGSTSYPGGIPFTFKTSSASKASPHQPLIGTVMDSTLQPVTESLLTLEVPGNQPIATITKVGGNFILPLISLQNIDKLPASLIVFDLERSSTVSLILPPTQAVLPPITLGQNLDLTNRVTTPEASPSTTINKHDLNGDGIVNALDRAIIYKNK